MSRISRLIRNLLISIAILFCSINITQANTTAKIRSILFYEGGNLIYVYPEGGVKNPPACHGSNGDYLSFKMTRPMAKEYLNGLLSAMYAKKTVFFRTAGACIDQSVSETINYFLINAD